MKEGEDIVSTLRESRKQSLNGRTCANRVYTLVRHMLKVTHDGDKTSSLSIFLDDAREEVYSYLNSPEAYINGDKKMIATAYVDSVERVLINITGD